MIEEKLPPTTSFINVHEDDLGHGSMSTRDLELLLQPSVPVPSTPKRKSPTQGNLDLVALSLGAASVTCGTKVNMKNDFREFRQASSARENTTRLSSMHCVDVSMASLDCVSGIQAHYVISDYRTCEAFGFASV